MYRKGNACLELNRGPKWPPIYLNSQLNVASFYPKKKRPFAQHKYSKINDCFMIHAALVNTGIDSTLNQSGNCYRRRTQISFPTKNVYASTICSCHTAFGCVALFSLATKITPQPQHIYQQYQLNHICHGVANLLHDVTITAHRNMSLSIRFGKIAYCKLIIK